MLVKWAAKECSQVVLWVVLSLKIPSTWVTGSNSTSSNSSLVRCKTSSTNKINSERCSLALEEDLRVAWWAISNSGRSNSKIQWYLVKTTIQVVVHLIWGAVGWVRTHLIILGAATRPLSSNSNNSRTSRLRLICFEVDNKGNWIEDMVLVLVSC